MKRACVIGWPIGHSRSPLIHNHWLRLSKIDGVYSREAVEPGNLQRFITSLPKHGYVGCNVTVPHKEHVFQLVKPADDATMRLGAMNTLYFQEGELVGTNTDGEGFINSLLEGAPGLEIRGKRAVVLGAGGAAMSVVDALISQRVQEIALVNRSRERAELLRSRLGPVIQVIDWEKRSDVLTECDLLVNTTSLGMQDQPPLDIGLTRLHQEAVVTDIIYVPLRTVLLDTAAARGHCVVEGLGMLLHQAVRGFELWFGQRPQVTRELHDIVARDIDPAFHR